MVVELALAVAFAAAAAVGALVWPLTPRRRVLRVCSFAGVYFGIELVVLTRCGWLWVKRAVGRGDGEGWVEAHQALLGWTLNVILRAGRAFFGFRLELTEPPDTESLAGSRPVLVLARQGGPRDTFALVRLLSAHYRRRCRIVVKEALALDPALDVLLGRLGCVFVSGTGMEGTTDRIAAVAAQLGPAEALLLFPEGGNWTPDRHDAAVRRVRGRRRRPGRGSAGSRGDRPFQAAETLEYLLPPRAGGVLACLTAAPDLEVVFVAHTGLEELVTVGQVWAHLPLRIPMSVRWWKAGSRPLSGDRQAGEDWLETEWAIMDEWIGTQADRGRRLPSSGLAEEERAGEGRAGATSG
jgi:1-acyl-sn-glycerol-3-phosphate acyltransferase